MVVSPDSISAGPARPSSPTVYVTSGSGASSSSPSATVNPVIIPFAKWGVPCGLCSTNVVERGIVGNDPGKRVLVLLVGRCECCAEIRDRHARLKLVHGDLVQLLTSVVDCDGDSTRRRGSAQGAGRSSLRTPRTGPIGCADGRFEPRRLTDAVTLSRVPIALVMLLVRRRPAALAGSFLLGVTTDLVDGPLARRFGTSSARGVRLDSAADAAFVAASAVTAAATVDEALRAVVGRVAVIVAVTRFVALLVTRRRFGSWSVMHSRLNRATGLGLATVVAVALVRGRMPIVALGAVAALAEIAAIEELTIVITTSEYDADRTSLFGR